MAQAGAQAFREPVQRRFDFAYTTIQRLRDEGITSSVLSDTRALAAIRRASTTINRVTGQWFFPVESTERVSIPFNRPHIHLKNMIPILDVRSLKLETVGTATPAKSYTVAADRFRIDDRFIELAGEKTTRVGPHVYSRPERFQKGVLNYILDATFGHLERRPFSDIGSRFKSTTTTATVSNDDTTISVTDSSDFRVGDVVLCRSGTASSTFSFHAMVTGLGSPNQLTTDPINLAQAAPSGSTIITYGQVPEEVQMACVLIINDRKYGLATEQFSSQQVQHRIKMEQTDNYTYSLESGSGGSSEANTTGNVEADRLLSSYHAPHWIGGV